jgi:hypothetical protein
MMAAYAVVYKYVWLHPGAVVHRAHDVDEPAACGGTAPPSGEPRCPQCNGPLEAIRYPSYSYLNRDQWESQVAGNYYCRTCPPNNRGADAWCYWWEREVIRDPGVWMLAGRSLRAVLEASVSHAPLLCGACEYAIRTANRRSQTRLDRTEAPSSSEPARPTHKNPDGGDCACPDMGCWGMTTASIASDSLDWSRV